MNAAAHLRHRGGGLATSPTPHDLRYRGMAPQPHPPRTQRGARARAPHLERRPRARMAATISSGHSSCLDNTTSWPDAAAVAGVRPCRHRSRCSSPALRRATRASRRTRRPPRSSSGQRAASLRRQPILRAAGDGREQPRRTRGHGRRGHDRDVPPRIRARCPQHLRCRPARGARRLGPPNPHSVCQRGFKPHFWKAELTPEALAAFTHVFLYDSDLEIHPQHFRLWQLLGL